MQGYRTFAVSLLLIAIGQIQTWTTWLKPYLTPESYGWVISIVGFIVLVLRVLTATPMFAKVVQRMQSLDERDQQGGYISPILLAMLVLAVIFIMILIGCTRS